jgi:hypothetical protein
MSNGSADGLRDHFFSAIGFQVASQAAPVIHALE